jgi:hypothetical protein|uniref:Uncharacterized protein n=1 Tax=Myoviridae sp. ctshb19 TaxID=2825194 RepID=A0A8S5UGV9_9CAUD|nr:MAG TPA: hypothetical protein [Myoviridae sp. ctshb19]
MWESLSSDEQLEFLVSFCGASASYAHIDLELVLDAESRLNVRQRIQYVDWISGFIADATYRQYDPNDAETAMHYYFNLMRASVELRAKLLWHAIKGIQP